MLALLHPGFAYIRHRLRAGNRHDVHSPFVYELIEQALRPSASGGSHPGAEELRKRMRASDQRIAVADLGAGSHRNNAEHRRVAGIARTALKPRKRAEQLARIVAHFNPHTLVELGTSLGITTLYLAQAAPQARVHTIEGAPAIATIAGSNFKAAGTANIRLHIGSFQEKLPRVLATMEQLDLAYIDGHHAEEPTLHYFVQCLEKAHNDTVFLFDDIHWSKGMERAWARVRAHEQVTVSIDLYHLGLVFLRKEQQKEHFTLRY